MKEDTEKIIFDSGLEIKKNDIIFNNIPLHESLELNNEQFIELSEFMIKRWNDFACSGIYLNNKYSTRPYFLFGKTRTESKKNIKGLIDIIEKRKEDNSKPPMDYLEISDSNPKL